MGLRSQSTRCVRAFGRYMRYRYLRRAPDYAAALNGSIPLLTYIGYLGQRNIGDEALYVAYRDKLFARALLVPFDDVSALSLLARLKATRLVLLGGGTLINVNPYLESLERFRRNNRPYAVFGTGVADLEYWAQHPQYERGNAERWIDVLANAKYVGVRGPRSKQWLHERGIATAEMIGDPALSIAIPARAADKDESRPQVLGINLGSHDPVSGGAEPTLMATAELVRYAVARGYRVKYVALHDIDVQVGEQLRQIVGGKYFAVPAFSARVDHALQNIQECDYLVGQRLHATVLACALGVPTLSLSYQPKCLDFLESVNREDLSVSTAGISGAVLVERFEWLCSMRDQLRKELQESCDHLRRLQKDRAERLFAQLCNQGNALDTVDA